MSKKLVQINVTCNGSTGRIMGQIQQEAKNQGWEAYSFFGRGKPTNDKCFKIGNKFDVLFHVLITRLFDKHGHGSKRATKKLIKQIEQINPDVIQLHNIHGYYLHIETLFNYLKKCNKKIIWSLHDCWAFTGHCSHFTCPKCNKWQTGCNNCIRKKDYPKSSFLDSSRKEYLLKKKMFTELDNITFVVASKWLLNLFNKSFLKEKNVKLIKNGIDLNTFKPTSTIDIRKKYNIPDDKKIILGVAAVWSENKGLKDFYELAEVMDDKYIIVLIGLNKKQINNITNKNIIGISRTENVEEIANFYSSATVFYNPSKEESFSLTTIEAIACGTPVIGYNTGAIAEMINNNNNGSCLELGKQYDIKKIIDEVANKKLMLEDISEYSIETMTKEYINVMFN